MTNDDPLDTVAFDIETTGLAVQDQVTVVGFDAASGSRIFLTTGEMRCPPDLEAQVDEAVNGQVALSVHETERALLAETRAFVASTLAEQRVKITAYNGEGWNGGFDLPFLRTRLSQHGIDWPFAELPYVDAMDVFKRRFNTVDDSLPDVYAELIGGELTRLDPFTDSAEAVDAWEQGNFEALVTHNLADIRRTRALMDLAERYCSKSDFSMKSLDPVV